MTQTETILNYLKLGKSITALEALSAFGCLRLASRISEIKQQGYNVTSDTVKENGKHFSRYYLYAK